MVMIFAHPRVRAHLLEKKIVYSYRKDHPKTSDGVRKQIGDDWANAKRGGKKIADIHITPMETVEEDTLYQVLPKYARESGFYRHQRQAGSAWTPPGKTDSAVSSWVWAIEQLNKNKPIRGWIYKVEIRGNQTPNQR